MVSSSVSLPASVTLAEGEGGLPVVRVQTSLASGELYLNGAHVTSWTPTGSQPVIWVSGSSEFAPGKAIRGGIPLCFPWFGPGREPGLAPAHGFARLALWRLVEARDDDGEVTLVLGLTQADIHGVPGAGHWPHSFSATYTVTFARDLIVALRVENTGEEMFSYEEALHTYLAVTDIRSTSVQGLAGTTYLDKVSGAVASQDGDVSFTGETDRVYNSACTAVVTGAPGRSVLVTKVNSVNTVVWNPWMAKSAAMPDFGDDEWTGMVCVETANVLDDAIDLAPGESHTMSSRYAVTD